MPTTPTYSISWDQTGEHFYETGVDHGVLYPYAETATIDQVEHHYAKGVAWNGLTSIQETPSGAESNPLYADNIKYLDLRSAEEFGATIEAYTYPDEFAVLDGSGALAAGVSVGQQTRGVFGLCYRTRIGNDTDGDNHGYKLHLVYGATANPSERQYETVNDNPDAIQFSWEITTIPVQVSGFKPTAIVTIDSTKANSTDLATLEQILYGNGTNNPRLPLPDEVKTIMTTTNS